MKKKIICLLIISFGLLQLFAQSLPIGHTTMTFNDPNRTGGFGSGAGPGRQIQTEIYYPAASAGENVAVANGNWPLIVFGHGFAMNWDAYSNIWNELVPLGYIMAFPRTESGLFPSPSHGDFGQDLTVIAQKMSEEGLNTSSFFYDKISEYVCAMGHSMGGGAAALAASQSNLFDCYLGLAPAETTPSAISAAANIQLPSLILSGSNDGVTPPAQHHLPIYDAISNACKSFANINGGGHCYFANTNFNCDFGESTSSTGISLSRAEQQSLMFQQIKPWLAYFLDKSCTGYDSFINYPINGISLSTTCPNFTTSVTIAENNGILSTSATGLSYQWYLDGSPINGATNDSLVVGSNFSGTYSLLVNFTYGCTMSNNLVKVDEWEQHLKVYPNPTSTELYINSLIESETPFLLQNIQGQMVAAGALNGFQTKIEVQELPNGIYLLEFPAYKTACLKVLIQH